MTAGTPQADWPPNAASIRDLLEPEILEEVDGRCVLRFSPEPTWTLGNGVVQGGIVTAMLDMAMAIAAGGCSTATITVDILRPVTGPVITSTGVVDKRGKRLLFASAELHDAEGRLVARGNQTAVPYD